MDTFSSSRDGVGLRCALPEDEGFLFGVFASTREKELALTAWSPPQKAAFLRMQFDAQRQSYAMTYPDAEYSVIQRDGRDVGRTIVHRNDTQIALIDIALLPEHRNRGIGSSLVLALMKEASQGSRSILLHVERLNPALRWYQKLGFKVASEGAIYLEMIWRTDEISARSSVGLRDYGDRINQVVV
jgi:ribosomal protein S18 acetylase RimI-like enzyme